MCFFFFPPVVTCFCKPSEYCLRREVWWGNRYENIQCAQHQRWCRITDRERREGKCINETSFDCCFVVSLEIVMWNGIGLTLIAVQSVGSSSLFCNAVNVLPCRRCDLIRMQSFKLQWHHLPPPAVSRQEACIRLLLQSRRLGVREVHCALCMPQMWKG